MLYQALISYVCCVFMRFLTSFYVPFLFIFNAGGNNVWKVTITASNSCYYTAEQSVWPCWEGRGRGRGSDSFQPSYQGLHLRLWRGPGRLHRLQLLAPDTRLPLVSVDVRGLGQIRPQVYGQKGQVRLVRTSLKKNRPPLVSETDIYAMQQFRHTRTLLEYVISFHHQTNVLFILLSTTIIL